MRSGFLLLFFAVEFYCVEIPHAIVERGFKFSNDPILSTVCEAHELRGGGSCTPGLGRLPGEG